MVVSASVQPTYVICPKFGGETTVTLTWNTANAMGIAFGFIGVEGQLGGEGGWGCPGFRRVHDPLQRHAAEGDLCATSLDQ
jgi:hypothetical protein